MNRDHRKRARLPLDQNATVLQQDGNTASGQIIDMSSSGAAVEINTPEGAPAHQLGVGQSIDIEADDMMPLSGEIVRVDENGVAVNFDLAEEDEDSLISEIMSVHNHIPLDDNT